MSWKDVNEARGKLREAVNLIQGVSSVTLILPLPYEFRRCSHDHHEIMWVVDKDHKECPLCTEKNWHAIYKEENEKLKGELKDVADYHAYWKERALKAEQGNWTHLPQDEPMTITVPDPDAPVRDLEERVKALEEKITENDYAHNWINEGIIPAIGKRLVALETGTIKKVGSK